MEQPLLSRREFTRLMLRICVYGGFLGGAVITPRRVLGDTSSDSLDLWELNSLEYDTVEAAAVILLGTEVAEQARVAYYIDHYLGAFSDKAPDTPKIFGGGPFSGRQGGTANFDQFLPLSRVKYIRWQSYLEDVKDKYHKGLGFLNRRSRILFGVDFPSLSPARQKALIVSLTNSPHSEFLALLFQHAIEGMWSDPVYDGNADLAGWMHIGFPGDIQPKGYTDSETSEPDEGAPELTPTTEIIEFIEQLGRQKRGGPPNVQ